MKRGRRVSTAVETSFPLTVRAPQDTNYERHELLVSPKAESLSCPPSIELFWVFELDSAYQGPSQALEHFKFLPTHYFYMKSNDTEELFTYDSNTKVK